MNYFTRFALYETKSRLYLVATSHDELHCKLLKIERDAEPPQLGFVEDATLYTYEQLASILAAIESGSKSVVGGFRRVLNAFAILGFIQFTSGWYISVITKRKTVALLGGYYLYHIEATELIPVSSSNAGRSSFKGSEESRFVSIFQNLDLSKTFYYSYSYDITQTLQHNILRLRANPNALPEYSDMFVWNHFLMQPAQALQNPQDWLVILSWSPINKSDVSVYGRSVFITVIARRSRYFAGARFLKRGVNDKGFVANDVETEQIVADMQTTSFHAPGGALFANPNYSSYVQHRGSIPLYWTQEGTNMTPKPPITLTIADPFYQAAALHFDNMFERYGAPCIVLNLVKSRERIPRESLLLYEFTKLLEYLNQFLPQDRKIQHIAWDMSRASKGHSSEVIDTLEDISQRVLQTTGFFYSGQSQASDYNTGPSIQSGVCRMNCIDCLDRTNAAQFVIGKRALGYQLHALGVISEPKIKYDSDAVNLLTELYHDHGDTIALQYGGSHLVNTMETYRKINQAGSHTRDMIESIRRFYNNSFLDSQRQEAINLFLGNYVFVHGQPKIWEMPSDHHLHNDSLKFKGLRRHYQQWWTPANLEKPVVAPQGSVSKDEQQKLIEAYWTEYYRPRVLSSLCKVFAYNVNSTLRYIPVRNRLDLGPFRPHASIEKDRPSSGEKRRFTPGDSRKIRLSLHRWLPHSQTKARNMEIRSHPEVSSEKEVVVVPQRTMEGFVSSLLNPVVTMSEMAEYEQYITHPQLLPLTSSTDLATAHPEYSPYVNELFKEGSHQEDLTLFEKYVDMSEKPMQMQGSLNSLCELEEKRRTAYAGWIIGKTLGTKLKV
ncbi:Polyphosphoinositide phosphatase [Neolecta irregularis DAH-3]|uniref:Polyphosphoinositide phosphatase n=1 Tax=Neolecta irregularis (strain DAH-3) TaxID=1198029 RepID=A0A1U7LS82_NEOID|nr:Polyphosphoinositide phosphatase [Neolecta irregularis DAH-3]|eukprot:OLL25504.1 Polyphosphoinositide phosphatase [Neolecta irregularis DAH-3]